MSRPRRLLRVLLWGGGLTVALGLSAVVGGGIWLTTPGGNDFLGGLIADQVSDLMPLGEMRVGSLRTDVVSYAELSDVTLHRWDGGVLVSVPTIRLEHRLPRLGQKSVPLRSLTIAEPDVRIEQLDDGQLDLLIAFGVTDEPSTEPPTAWEGLEWLVTLPETTLADGRLTWVSGETTQVVEALSLSTDLSVGGGRLASLSDLSVHAEPDGYAPVDLTGALRYDAGNLFFDDLSLSYDQSRVGVEGTIHQVELDMALGLTVTLDPLAAGQLSQWTDDQTPMTDLTGSFSVRGPLSEMQIDGWLRSEAGDLALNGGLDLIAEPMSWALTAQTNRLDLDALLPPVTEPTRLAGTYTLTGAGTSWPDDVTARIEITAEEQILWGEPVDNLSFAGDIAGGKLTIEDLTADHPVAAAGITGGWVDIVGQKASVQTDVSLPTLAALTRYDQPGYLGSLVSTGSVEVDWSQEQLRVDAFPLLVGTSIRGDGFSVGDVRSEGLQVTLIGDEVTFQGGVVLSEIDAAGLDINTVTLSEISGGWSAARGVSFATQVDMGRLLVGDGTFELAGLSGPVSGAVPPVGEPDITSELVLGELTLLPAAYKIDGGPVTLEMKDSGLEVGLSLSREGRVVIQAKTFGDLDSQQWRVEELSIFPTSERGIVSLQEIPIRFTLVESGVNDLELVLVVSDDPTRRTASLDEASYISMAGGTGGDEPNIDLEVRRLPLSWVSDLLNTFLAEDGTAFVAPMQGSVDGQLSLKGITGEAALSGDITLVDFTYPEQASGIGLTATLSGQLSTPGAAFRISDDDGLLLALDGLVPLDLDAATLDCADEIAIRGLLAPIELERLGRALPAASGLTGLGSADIHLTGPACDPRMTIVGAASVPVGAKGEHMRLDLRVDRGEDGVVVVEATADEALMRRFQASGSIDNNITEMLPHLLPIKQDEPETPEERDARAQLMALIEELEVLDPSLWINSVNLDFVPLAVPLESLTKLFGLPSGLKGRLAGGVHVSGTLDSPEATGGLLLVEGQIGEVAMPVATLNLFPEKSPKTGSDGYHLLGAFDFGDQGNLSIDGFVPLTIARLREEELTAEAETELMVTVGGDGVPLAVLNGLVDGVSEATGRLTIDGTVRGTVEAPNPEIDILLKDGGLVYRPVGLRFSDMNVDLLLSDGALIFRNAILKSAPSLATFNALAVEPGELTVRGTVGMNGFSPGGVALNVGAEQFWLTATNEYTAAVRGDMKIRGSWPALTVEGGVALTEGRFIFDDSFFLEDQSLALDPRITIYREQEALQTVAGEEEVSELMEKLSMKLKLDLNRNLRLEVDMPLLDTYGGQISSLSTVSVIAEMDGELDVAYRGGALSVNGTIETLTGSTTRLFDTSFAVSDGSAVYFVGDEYADPILKMEAVHSNTSYGDVNVTISGTAESPEVALSSDGYDETDILFLLLFGKPASEMSEGESGAGAILLSTALASLSGQVTRALGGTFIDEIDWDADSGLRIGKALSEKLFLAYDRNSNADINENINQITLEWIISRRMYAEFMTGDMAQSSADLYWRWLF